jgi:hypothetical protein
MLRSHNRDGTKGQCPVCRASLPSPKELYSVTSCPRCDAQLWLLAFASGTTFFVRRAGEAIYDLLSDLAGDRLSADEIESILRDADALEVAELLSEIEDAIRT